MKIGAIGYGERMAHVINLILGYDLGVELSAITDINPESITVFK